MKKAVIYYRISTPTQDEKSQLEDLKEWASDKYEVDKRIFGEIKSGYSAESERDEFERMKKYVVENNIPNILIWEISRMSRKLIQTLKYIEFFTEHNINVVFKKEGLETLKGGYTNNLLINMLSSMAEMERNLINDRMQRGRMQKAIDGKRIGWSFMPLGYTTDENNYIIIDEKTEPIVQDIFQMSIKGLSTTKIANELNARKIPTFMQKSGKRTITRMNGKSYPVKWAAKTVQNIIEATRYKGYRDYAGITISTPRIVSDEIWEEANRKIVERIGYKTRVKHQYLLAGKVVCGHCNYSLRVRRKVKDNKKKKEIFYYYCDSQILTGEPKCNTGRFDSKQMDKHIYQRIIVGILTSQIRKDDESGEKEKTLEKISYWESQIQALNKEKKQIINLYKKALIEEDELDKDIARITRELNLASSEITRLKITLADKKRPLNITVELMRKYFWESDFKTRKTLVDEYLQKVVCYRVNELKFDITKQLATTYTETADGKILVDVIGNFQKPVQNGVLYYVEIFTYFKGEPTKVLISSARGINFTSPFLVYDIQKRCLSLNIPSKFN